MGTGELDVASGPALEFRPAMETPGIASRCELYLTDPRTEKRKTRWIVELAFLTRP